MALGGELAYWYGRNRSLAGFSLSAAQQVVGAANFGSEAQQLLGGLLAHQQHRNGAERRGLERHRADERMVRGAQAARAEHHQLRSRLLGKERDLGRRVAHAEMQAVGDAGAAENFARAARRRLARGAAPLVDHVVVRRQQARQQAERRLDVHELHLQLAEPFVSRVTQ